MSESTGKLKYARSHEWARLEEDGCVTVGVSDHAQEALGDVVFVELPQVGDTLIAGGEAGVVESVKAASDIIAPLGGKVMAINDILENEPETVNASPLDEGWFYKLQPADVDELDDMLSAEEYNQYCVESD
ncbi:MAG: glycine cleavage system protein GcvH [Halieaceae bacterium]|jgi:glycine cleavage system H protein|nr:glycine cleavage system protein GcvH [Halieaceae bacterium]